MFRITALAVCLLLASNESSSAQGLFKRLKQNTSQHAGTTRQPQLCVTSPISSNQYAVQGTTNKVPCNCGCSNPSGSCWDLGGNCITPVIIPGTCCIETNCKDIPVVFCPQPDINCVKKPAYQECKSEKRKVKVPETKEICEEFLKFKNIDVPFPCCKVQVCVPCAICVKKSKVCEPVIKEITVEICKRWDNSFDVYAINVPGMPTKYVLELAVKQGDLDTKFPR